MSEPESLILQLLRQMRAELGDARTELSDMRANFANKSDVDGFRAELRAEMNSLRADVASDIMTTRKELSEQIVGLRRAVIDYHTTVVGHGVLISDLEARVRRVEQHLNLPSMGG